MTLLCCFLLSVPAPAPSTGQEFVGTWYAAPAPEGRWQVEYLVTVTKSLSTEWRYPVSVTPCNEGRLVERACGWSEDYGEHYVWCHDRHGRVTVSYRGRVSWVLTRVGD